ncbi:MAG: hypothetical protein LLG08_09655 [Actinomycetia bacterium]|nr:hypothetical protein [Actinomycetes bacterium]
MANRPKTEMRLEVGRTQLRVDNHSHAVGSPVQHHDLFEIRRAEERGRFRGSVGAQLHVKVSFDYGGLSDPVGYLDMLALQRVFDTLKVDHLEAFRSSKS